MNVATGDLLMLLLAVPLAAVGGAIFLSGVLGVSQILRLPNFFVATTLAAFATSSPEMAVSSMAAWSGKPGIGLGDALGSNVVNLGLILGGALLLGTMRTPLNELKRDWLWALSMPLLTLLLALDGTLSRGDGALLLGVFAAWTAVMWRQARTHRRNQAPETEDTPHHAGKTTLALLGGLAALVLAGRLFVLGASGVAAGLGVPPYVIGATVVAMGTSLPEIVTVLLARWRGHDDVGLGTLLGSNLFNGMAVVGVAASITPIRAPLLEVGVATLAGAAMVALTWPHHDRLTRWRGAALLLAYTAFVTLTTLLQ